MVGQPQSRPTLIGVHQAPIGVHGPRTLLSRCIEEWEGRGCIPALQGLSTLGGGYCHDLFPLLSPISLPLHKPHQSHLTDPSQNFPDLISSMDQSRSHPTGPLGPHSNAFQATTRTPVETGLTGLRDRMAFQDHVTITQPCITHATSSAGHLASRPGT